MRSNVYLSIREVGVFITRYYIAPQFWRDEGMMD